MAPSLLLHPLDFLGRDDEADLSFFPGMGMPGARKVALVSEVIRMFVDQYDVLPMCDHARDLSRSQPVPAQSQYDVEGSSAG
jgi:hypothetical protein